MRRVVVTGLGFITSIGNSREEVLRSLREGTSGIEVHPELAARDVPVKLAGTIKGFQFPSPHSPTWKFPPGVEIPRVQLRSLPPNGVFAIAAMREAITDARLTPELVSHERTGLMCASAGSGWLLHRFMDKFTTEGPLQCHPMSLAASIAGALNFNLVSSFKIKGASGGFTSACASSAHAFGAAIDQIRLDRQDRVFVVGAEDCNLHSILPFASCRALTTQTDPALSPCAFDVKRDGFAATGGAAVLVLEELEQARERGVPIYAEVAGWAQTSDGYDIMAPEPDGAGLARAMKLALEDAKLAPGDIDYINAHATSTIAGDRAEMRALKKVFAGKSPAISSTKSQTGHGLSLAGAMEAAFCCLALREQFIPASINITELDPEAQGLNIVTEPAVAAVPSTILSNSSGFGGANVVLAFKKL